MRNSSRSSVALLGMSFFSAALASSCCLFPVLLGLIGITGFTFEFDFFESNRVYPIVFSVLLFGVSVFLSYRCRSAQGRCSTDVDSPACKPTLRRFLLMWGVAILILVFLIKFPDFL